MHWRAEVDAAVAAARAGAAVRRRDAELDAAAVGAGYGPLDGTLDGVSLASIAADLASF